MLIVGDPSARRQESEALRRRAVCDRNNPIAIKAGQNIVSGTVLILLIDEQDWTTQISEWFQQWATDRLFLGACKFD